MKTRYKVLLGAAALATAATAGRYTVPTKVVETEKIVYQEKIVIKKVYVKDTSKKVNKVTIRLVTIKPDGTRTIETKIFDKSEIEIVTKGESTTTDDITKETDKTKVAESSHDNTIVSLGVKMDVTAPAQGYSYGLLLNKRLLGPITGGAFGFTDGTAGASLGLSW